MAAYNGKIHAGEVNKMSESTQAQDVDDLIFADEEPYESER